MSIDGVQFSNGRIATFGFFDLQQVEVLKGPQALFFGKNASAGVISVTTAGPTDRLEIGGRATYEFVGDEATIESHISGPITDTLKGRLALRYRNLEGWMRNDAQPFANPFYTAGQPAGAARLPGSVHKRLGDHDYLGRVTLQYDPNDAVSSTLKVFRAHQVDTGNGSAVQNIGPCPTGQPKVYGIADPFGECRRDNHVTYGDIPAAIASTANRGRADGVAYGSSDIFLASLTSTYKFDKVDVTSVTGFSRVDNYSYSGLDSTVFSQLAFVENTTDQAISQELRALTSFDSPFNVMVGGYFQKTRLNFFNDGKFRDDTSFNPANGRYTNIERIALLEGETYSAFGQLIWNIRSDLELVGGARFTAEKKTFTNRNLYGIGVYATNSTIYPSSVDKTPGVLAGRFKDNNVSPEVTLTYHPGRDSTLYVAYKTGFKSGGFGVQTPLSRTTTISDIDFGSESTKGVEAGAKAELLDRRLRLTSAIFRYDFNDLQVTTFDASSVTFNINNVGKVQQRGAELEANFQANDIVALHGAVTYVHNRFKGYTGQCYGYTIPVAQALTAAPPPNCSFVTNAAGGRALTASGAAILQQVYDGRAPSRSPDWAANAGISIELPLRGATRFGLTGDTFYSGRYIAGDTQAPSTVQNAFWRFNAGARLMGADDRWEVGLIGRNLTNKYYLQYAGDRTGGTSVPLTIGEQRGVVSRGREIALQAGFKFR